ncbi:MAG TPA: VWA domain-containing protein [Candidatus Acidoferrales bacterium]|nr:VWA domain-containing protein [Candidatus Acidoferrales bacterium]
MKIEESLVARRVVVALAMVLLPMSISAQDASQLPKIHVATRLVQIGVIVRDKHGPVSNLTQDDFTVLDRGKPQTISIFSTDAALATQQPPERPLPPNTFSDLPHYGALVLRSVTIVLLDNLNTLYGSMPQDQYESTPFWVEGLALQRARAHLLEFLKTVDPRDRVAIYGLRDSLHVLCDFTSDRAELLAIVSKYDTSSVTNRAVVAPAHRGHPYIPLPSSAEQASSFENGAALTLAGIANEERARITMAALASIANHVANIPGRKNLVWLTAELPFSGAAMARVLSPANIAVYPVDARGLLAQQVPTEALTGTADADDVSGASGHMDNMPAQSSQPIGIATMQKLADETGGQAFVNTNDITGAIRKAVEDSEVTYTLGFYINGDSLDGKLHELKVETKRKGLTIRYPKGYFAFPDTEATKDEDQFRLVSAVQSPIESSSIQLTATVDRVDQPPHSLKVLCSIEAHNLRLVQSGGLRKGSVEVYIVEQDQTGKVVLQSGKTFTLQFPEKQYEALLKSGILFHEFVQPHPGATTLRVLVEDPSTSELGSVIIPLAQIK